MTLSRCNDVFGTVTITFFFYHVEVREFKKILHDDTFKVRAQLCWFSTLKYGESERNDHAKAI